MRRGSTKLENAREDLKAKIDLIEQHVKKTNGPYGPDQYPKQQVEGWIGDLKKSAQKDANLIGAEAQVKILMTAMNIQAAPVQKPVSRFSQAIRRGSGARKESSQSIERSSQPSVVVSQSSSRPESQISSAPSSASASPQVSRANPPANPYKVTDAQLKTIIAKEKELSKVVQEKGHKLDPEIKAEINRNIQAVYQYEARLNTSKPVQVTADAVIATLDGMKNLVENEIKKEEKLEETLNEIFNKQPTESEMKEASINEQTNKLIDDMFQEPTAAELEELEVKNAASTLKNDNLKETASAATTVALDSSQQKNAAANTNTAAGTTQQDAKVSVTNASADSPQQGREATKKDVAPESPTSQRPRIKLVGLKEIYKNKNQSSESAVPPKPTATSAKPVETNPMIQGMLRQSKSNSATTVAQNAAQEPPREKTRITTRSGPK